MAQLRHLLTHRSSELASDELAVVNFVIGYIDLLSARVHKERAAVAKAQQAQLGKLMILRICIYFKKRMSKQYKFRASVT